MSAEIVDLTAGYWRAIDLAEDWRDCARCGEEFCTQVPEARVCTECLEDAL